jgi:hypothetical protein
VKGTAMTRFTSEQIKEAYSLPYILPRRVTMVTDFATDKSIDLLPTYEIRVAPNQDLYVFDHVKWITVAAFNNTQLVGQGWIPKAVLHDLAYAALIRKDLTGVSFGGDKVDYDTSKRTVRTKFAPEKDDVKSRCHDCGGTLNAHKVHEDRDIAEKMGTLIGMLSNFEGSMGKKYGTAGSSWKPRNSGESVMLGMARIVGGKYILAYSGSSDDGRNVLEDIMSQWFAVKMNTKGKWSLAHSIPANTMQIRRRNGRTLDVREVNSIFNATEVSKIDSLERLQCAAPKLLHHAFDVMGADGIEAMTEAWYEPSNARSFQNSIGKQTQLIRRHGQTIPSCTRCSTVVRLLLCP